MFCSGAATHLVIESRSNTSVISEKCFGSKSISKSDHDSKLEYHSDESSDTGFSSLSSIEEDYSLSTLV